jgi:hypothetical protein
VQGSAVKRRDIVAVLLELPKNFGFYAMKMPGDAGMLQGHDYFGFHPIFLKRATGSHHLQPAFRSPLVTFRVYPNDFGLQPMATGFSDATTWRSFWRKSQDRNQLRN